MKDINLKKILLSCLTTVFLCITVNAQEKTVVGDTVHWSYRVVNKIEKDIELLDFETSKHDFDFRFRNMGQVVEIWRENDSIKGLMTNYIFWGRKGKSKTLFKKNAISPQKAESIYRMINDSKILNLPFDEGKYFCTDVNPYIFETADKQNYIFKFSWAICSREDSLQFIRQFVKQLDDTLQLRESYRDFRNTLPRVGTYSSGGIVITKYSNPISFELGYFGSTKLPVGYYAGLYFYSIGTKVTNIGISAEHRFDRQRNYDFSAMINKPHLFINNPKKIITGDFLSYNYRIRNLHFVDENTIFQNHKLIYCIDIKRNTRIGLGSDYSQGNDNKIGGVVNATRDFYNSKIWLNGEVSIFNDRLDYRARIGSSFPIKQKIFFHIGVQYESFINHGDIGFFLVAGL